MDKINISIGQDPNLKSTIGVLDIYGFESFKCNRYDIELSNWRDRKRPNNNHGFVILIRVIVS